MISIYYSYLSESNHPHLLQKYLPVFSDKFQNKIRAYRRWQDAQLSLLGRCLLAEGVKAIQGLEMDEQKIEYTPFNKPYFTNSSLKFNISHSGEIVACAFSNHAEIGIDIEIIGDIQLNDFKDQMTEYEWNEIMRSGNNQEAFFSYWARKEAVIKAHGEGLSIPLQSFEIIDNRTLLNEELFYVKEVHIEQGYKCFISSKVDCEVMLKKVVIG